MKEIIILIKKDLKIHFRTQEMLFLMIFLGLILVLIFSFAFGPQFNNSEEIAASSIWVALSFVSIINLNNSFQIEKDGKSFKALILTGVDAGNIFLSKFITSIIMLFMAALIIIPATLIFFNLLNIRLFSSLLLLFFLGASGFGVVGIILAAMTSSSNMNENLLTVILFPLVVPVIISVVKATKILFEDGNLINTQNWLKFLSLYDLAFLSLSYILFNLIIEE